MFYRLPLYLAAIVVGIGVSFIVVTYSFTNTGNLGSGKVRDQLDYRLSLARGSKLNDEIMDVIPCFEELESRKVPNGTNPNQVLSYAFLYAKIFSRYGYRLADKCRTDPWLHLVHKDQGRKDYCLNVFRNWTIANDKTAPKPPPKQIPSEMLEDYLLMNTTGLSDWYFNEHFGSTTFNWGKSVLNSYLEKARKKQDMAYGHDTQTVIRAAESVPMKGFRTAVIGSIRPWVEAILLVNGVASIVTVEYGKINTDHPQLSYAHPNTVGKQYLEDLTERKDLKEFDLIATFSSIEHAGLGRFGDVLDPWADVREMQKMWCMLKPGGIAMIGFEVMNDKLRFNAGRIYGPIRLPFMTAGFDIVAMFDENDKVDLTKYTGANWPLKQVKQAVQYMIVLKKRS